MIIVIPPTLYGYIGAILSALIIVCCAIGLTMHRDVYASRIRKDFYCYYTNVSNLIVLIYFSLIAPRLFASSALRRFIPFAEYSVTMAIMLTHLVFHFMIFPGIRKLVPQIIPCRETRILAADNLFIHYLVPWMTLLYWVLCSPQKNAVPVYAALTWMILPLVYVACIFLRAQKGGCIDGTDSAYPYPFLDAARFGFKRALVNCAALFILSVLLSGSVILIVRLLYALFGEGKALVLI